MGLGDMDFLDDGYGGGGGGKITAVLCSICLESVIDEGCRSWAKLKCGHQFHLDCIGSAFNIKGVMQCPNCRKIEKGQWLYANGSRPLPEFSMDDWVHDEDLHDLSYSEMSFGVHWCPFSGLTRLPTSVDEGEFSSSASHSCPYIAYFGPIHPSYASSRSFSDGSSFNNLWSGPSVPSEVPSSYDSLPMDGHYRSWDHFSPFAASSHIGSADQSSIQSVNPRANINSYDPQRPGIHRTIIAGNSSASRAHSSIASSMLPHYPGAVVRPRDHVPSFHSYFRQPNSNSAPRIPLITGRRSSGHRGLAQLGPITASSDHPSGFYIVSSNLSGRTFQEPENSHHDRIHSLEREHQLSFPSDPIDRDSIWGPFYPASGGSHTGIQFNGFHQRHGSDWMPQNRP